MSESLRDQLLKAGLAKTGSSKSGSHKPAGSAPRRGTPRSRRPEATDEMDLAHAYALRAQTEKSERERVAREAAEQARLRRERRLRLQELLDGRSLNDAGAEQARHFEHAGKIRRVYVTAQQLVGLNAGELGVVVQAGRYLLVERVIALRAQTIAPDALVLLVDPDAERGEDDVPDDLMW